MALDAPVHLAGSPHLGEGETFVFEIDLHGRRREAFLLRHKGRLHAFLNECPHWAVELDLGDGHFFDPALQRVYCKNHGALFRVENGICETGPCLGRALIQFTVEERSDAIVVGPNYHLP